MSIIVQRYDATLHLTWNTHARSAKNGLFLFDRAFMDYHSDRFQDHSLLFFRDSQLLAILPGNEKNNEYYSHAGLTFGGILTTEQMTSPLFLEIFSELVTYLRTKQFTRLTYKCIPHIYHSMPAEEDRYALFLAGAKLAKSELTTSIDLKRYFFENRRTRMIKKALRNSIEIHDSGDFAAFWDLLAGRLEERYGVTPTHTLGEIELLAGRFPKNIRLFKADLAGEMLAGVVVFDYGKTVHAQYIAANDLGRKLGALDLIFDYLITKEFTSRAFFDFGISTESGGEKLNVGLITQKEGFGGRAIVHETYLLDLAH